MDSLLTYQYAELVVTGVIVFAGASAIDLTLKRLTERSNSLPNMKTTVVCLLVSLVAIGIYRNQVRSKLEPDWGPHSSAIDCSKLSDHGNKVRDIVPLLYYGSNSFKRTGITTCLRHH